MGLNRILIVDDEYIGREMLRESLRWEDYGYTVVGEARNGIEATKLIEKLKPDVVFTDIRMPGMDGIELIRWIGAQDRFMLCVAISSYEEFTYAQQAFREGVVDYLTKLSLQPEDVIRVLKKLDSILMERHLQDVGKKAVEKQRYLDLLFSGKLGRAEHLKWQRSKAATFLVFTFMMKNEKDLQQLCDSLEQNPVSPGQLVVEMKNSMVLGIFRLNTSRLTEESGNIVQSVQRLGSDLAGYDPFIGITDPFSQESDLSRAYLQVLEIKDHSIFFSGRPSVSFTELEALERGGFNSRQLLDMEKIRLLIQHDSGVEEAKKHMLKVFRANVSRKPDNENIRLTYQEQMTQLCTLGQNENQSVNDQVHRCYEAFCKSISEVRTLSRMEKNLAALLDCVVDAKSRTRSYGGYVTEAIHYIDENIAGDLSLNTVAASVGISRIYLSQLFSREAKLTFSEFVLQRRIQKAKWLMRNTSKKVYEVSEETGFNSEQYFSIKFKEVTGMTPKDYRRSIAASGN